MAHLFTARCTFYPTVLRGVPLAFNDPRKESKRAFLFFCPMDKKNDMRILVSGITIYSLFTIYRKRDTPELIF